MSRISQLVTSASIMLLLSTPVSAASSDSHQSPVTGLGFFIAFAIAYLSRRRAIGGWLLYFYLQLYISFLFSFILLPQIIADLKPSNWNNALLYVMYFLSVTPVLAVEFIEVFVATRLLFRRTEANLNSLRWTLVALVAASITSVAIDLVWFKEDVGFIFDLIAAIFATIWAAYFWRARRVKAVFIDNNWTYDPQSTKRILTDEDKKRLRRRVLIASSITFMLFLVMMGSSLKQNGKAPDANIFFVPLFYAVIAAIVAWYLPIRKKSVINAVEASTQSNRSSYGDS